MDKTLKQKELLSADPPSSDFGAASYADFRRLDNEDQFAPGPSNGEQRGNSTRAHLVILEPVSSQRFGFNARDHFARQMLLAGEPNQTSVFGRLP